MSYEKQNREIHRRNKSGAYFDYNRSDYINFINSVMKVEVKQDCNKKERDFPKLMISKHNKTTLVLLCTPTEGTVLQSNGIHAHVGYHSAIFKSSLYEDFEGSITISND